MTTSPLAPLIDPRRAAVLVVDVQPLFTQGVEPPVEQVLPALRRFLAAAREAHVLRVFISVHASRGSHRAMDGLVERAARG